MIPVKAQSSYHCVYFTAPVSVTFPHQRRLSGAVGNLTALSRRFHFVLQRVYHNASWRVLYACSKCAPPRGVLCDISVGFQQECVKSLYWHIWLEKGSKEMGEMFHSSSKTRKKNSIILNIMNFKTIHVQTINLVVLYWTYFPN